MSVSRRAFFRSVGAGGVGALSASVVGFRGHEAEAAVRWGRETAWAPPVDPNQIRLDSNENPYGPGPLALDAIRAVFGEAGRYPDWPSADLTAALAKHHGVAEENIAIGAGSGELLRMSVFAFTSPTRPLVAGLPTFEDPGRHAAVAGTPIKEVPVDAALKLDLDAMARAAEGSGLVFLCNPNNPTGTLHPAGAVTDFIHRINTSSPDTVILVDEAYHHFVEDAGYASAVPLALENAKVVVCRTFSKIYGMAGLRVGYAVGRKEPIAALRRHKLPNSTNVLGSVAAVAALQQAAHLERQKQLNHDAREIGRQAFEKMGFTVIPSEANFFMVDIKRDCRKFQEACRAQNVLVGRPFPPLLTHTRISIGTADEMRRAVEVFRSVIGTATTMAVTG